MQFKSNGVPVLSDEEIEAIAYQLLGEVDSSCLTLPSKVPIPSILQYLVDNHGLKFTISDELGFRGLNKIRGKTILSQNTIILDSEIVHNDEPLFFMTAAHEIGHWRLHRHRKIFSDNEEETIDSFEDGEFSFWDKDESKFISKKKELITSIDWLEHHAKVFAASLLMPRVAFYEAVISVQRNIDINRNLGKIYLNDNPSSKNDFSNTIKGLQEIFGLSKQAIGIRIRELNLFIDNRYQCQNKDKEKLRAFSLEQDRKMSFDYLDY
ncbi:ImmA/IrrE family metallo-endopeptidase [Geobacter sp.]|uniref:ImmA/IrrE family metallo-endopeptidase n=1 Tax=Geobacter sp. TaxID=46610 RepID=UPI0027B8FF24|nr:ImmA/IrrE family metallo-endopeptidase [Geobacter sp.]